MSAIPEHLRCVHQGEQIAEVHGGCSVGMVPILNCAKLEQPVSLRSCKKLLQTQWGNLSSCEKCEQQENPNGKPAWITQLRGASPPPPQQSLSQQERNARTIAAPRRPRDEASVLAKLTEAMWKGYDRAQPVASLVEEIFNPTRQWGNAEVYSEPFSKSMAEAFQQAKAYLTTHPLKIPGEGRGIVTCAGSNRYFPAGWVLVSVLRELGCTLPVEWWVLNEAECPPERQAIAESLPGVTVRYLNRECPQARRPGGWESKAWTIIYSRFREVLFLDSDQVPIRDPSFLFDEPEYLEHGAVFWPDFSWPIKERAFRVMGLPVPTGSWRGNPRNYTPIESGQSLWDKRRHALGLDLWRWLNERSDYWYRWMHGDHNTLYLAYASLGIPYASPPSPGWTTDSVVSGAILQRDFAGEVLFQHKVLPTSKWSVHGTNHNPPGFVHGDLCEAALGKLRKLLYDNP